jgi:Ca-activated chloride channel family protein
MSFIWPEALWLLLAVPALVAAYLLVLRRKKKFALRYASLDLVKEAMGARIGFRRHVPPILFLAALAIMIAAIARPQATVTLPSQHETVILAMDVSGSMRATDVEPNRLVAAQNAAKAFISEQPENVRIGIVAFAGTATVAQAPTRNKEDLVAAIDRFQLQRATAIGSAILVSLATLFPKDGIDVATFGWGSEPQRGGRGSRHDGAERNTGPGNAKPVPPGSYRSAVIILLTDGQRTTGPDSVAAARLAADKGVRIFTVGVGTPEGKIVGFEGWSMHVRLDEETLKTIADLTRGEYFYAGTAVDLKKIYETLNSKLVLETKKTEVTALFAAAAALLATIAALLSLVWFNRIL